MILNEVFWCVAITEEPMLASGKPTLWEQSVALTDAIFLHIPRHTYGTFIDTVRPSADPHM
jgi:hypothetical protein